MVIYGYGLDPNEQDRLEEESFRRQWQGEKRRIALTTSVQLQETLREMYATLARDSSSYSTYDFVDAIAWRIYTEWCMDEEEKGNPDTYQGEGLMQFIERETYFAAERASKNGINVGHEEITRKVLGGLVARAHELFSDWHCNQPCLTTDKRNLRTSLGAYIGL